MSTSGKFGPVGMEQDGAYIIWFIGNNVVSCSFQIIWCDNKESWNVIRCIEYNSMLSKQHSYIIIFLVDQSWWLSYRLCSNNRRHMSPYNCFTVDMLFNIVGYNIDGNCATWNCLMQKLWGDRLAPSRRPSSPHSGARRLIGWCLTNAHNIIVFIFHTFIKSC